VAAAGYYEPSLVFLLGTETTLVSGEGAALHFREHRDALALVTADKERAFLESAAALDIRPGRSRRFAASTTRRGGG